MMFPSVTGNKEASRKQVEGSEDAEGAAIIEVYADLDLDFKEDNKPIPPSRLEGRCTSQRQANSGSPRILDILAKGAN